MKKLIALCMTFVLFPAMVGCGAKEQPETNENWDNIPMVMVDGQLYLDTGKESTAVREDALMDGEITSSVDGNKTPTEHNQSNFGTGYGYQYGEEGTIEICINGKWFVYAAEEVKNK